jgi:hypothetical protein
LAPPVSTGEDAKLLPPKLPGDSSPPAPLPHVDHGASGAYPASVREWRLSSTVAAQMFGAFAASMAVAYPLETLSTRMRMYPGAVVTVAAFAWRANGFRGFYRGFWLQSLKLVPAAAAGAAYFTYLMWKHTSDDIDETEEYLARSYARPPNPYSSRDATGGAPAAPGALRPGSRWPSAPAARDHVQHDHDDDDDDDDDIDDDDEEEN